MRGGYTFHSLNDPFFITELGFRIAFGDTAGFFLPAFFFLFFFSGLRVKEYIYEM